MYDYSNPLTPIGITDWRNEQKSFGIKLQDRFSHIYAIGKTGVGKTTLLLSMAADDVRKGYGLCLIEPHGDACMELIKSIPAHRANEIVYFDATSKDHPTGFNPLHNVPKDQRNIVASEMVLSFKKIWSDSWGPRLEYILRYCILTLLEYPAATLLDVTPLLLDQQYRNIILQFTHDSAIASFWRNEYEKYPPSLRTDAIIPILNKAGVFQSNSILRGIVGQQHGISMDEIMSKGKILVCNLAKGLIGEDVSQILGSLIITAIQTAAMRRSALPESKRRPFMVFVDECHSFVSSSFASMMSEVRKMKVSLYLTHQYLDQFPEEVKNGILGNVGTLITFRLSAQDARSMEQEFYPIIKQADFISLPRFGMYIKLLIDGVASRPFSASANKNGTARSP